MREQLVDMTIPRTFLYPAVDGGVPSEDGLIASGVRVVAIPDSGHNIMLDNVDGFASAVAKALAEPVGARR